MPSSYRTGVMLRYAMAWRCCAALKLSLGLRSVAFSVFIVIVVVTVMRRNGHQQDPVLAVMSPPMTIGHQYQWYNEKMTNTESFPLPFYRDSVRKWKRILFWTDVYASAAGRWYGIDGIGKDVFKKAGCPVWQCEADDFLLTNKSHLPLEDYDALIFHDATWQQRGVLPEKRFPHQRYIFWTVEAPGTHNHLDKWNQLAGVFNWTWTYRWDSDIVHPSGWVTPSIDTHQKAADGITVMNYAEGKTKMAAWFVSHCDTFNGRNEYVERLQEFIPVDVYGACGTLSCNQTNDDSCRKMLEKDYKFYLAFENSLCVDYVTEKLFATIRYNIVPVVLDLHGNYDRLAPPKSFINALDFETVRDLADYLVELDRNDTLYNEYFQWKGLYTIYYGGSGILRGLCKLCSLLHGPDQPASIYQNLTQWWHSQSQCQVLKFSDDADNVYVAGNDESGYPWTTQPFVTINK